MAELASLARPYVRAVFDIARAESNLGGWNDQLELISVVVSDSRVAALEGNPRVTREQLADLVIAVCGDGIGDGARNLVRLLAENRRLSVVPEIAAQYVLLRAEAENQVEAELMTATEVDEAQRQKISDALQARLGRSVKLSYSVDTGLLGGAVIRTGDWVYDGSVKAQLQKMAAALSA